MMHCKKDFLCLAAVLCLTSSGIALAETITTKTFVTQKELPNVEKTDFSAFDLNGDNVLSKEEVGEKLFYIFDRDGNEVIDSVEFDYRQMMTVIPMKKEIYSYVDWDNDGKSDQVISTREEFIQQSRLMRFDEDMDGLSAADFIEADFFTLDHNRSGLIELYEWKEQYMDETIPRHARQDRYN